MITDLFGIVVIESVNVKNHVILENIWIIKIVSLEKKIGDKVIEECSENVDENKTFYYETLDSILSSDNKTSDSCIVYIVSFSVFLIINISMTIYVCFFLY